MLCTEDTDECRTKRKKYVRQLAQGISESIVPDDELIQAIELGDSRMQTQTRNHAWTPDLPDWLTALDISNHIAAATILSRVKSQDAVKKSADLLADSTRMIKSVIGIGQAQGNVFMAKSTNDDPQGTFN